MCKKSEIRASRLRLFHVVLFYGHCYVFNYFAFNHFLDGAATDPFVRHLHRSWRRHYILVLNMQLRLRFLRSGSGSGSGSGDKQRLCTAEMKTISISIVPFYSVYMHTHTYIRNEGPQKKAQRWPWGSPVAGIFPRAYGPRTEHSHIHIHIARIHS